VTSAAFKPQRLRAFTLPSVALPAAPFSFDACHASGEIADAFELV